MPVARLYMPDPETVAEIVQHNLSERGMMQKLSVKSGFHLYKIRRKGNIQCLCLVVVQALMMILITS